MSGIVRDAAGLEAMSLWTGSAVRSETLDPFNVVVELDGIEEL